MLNNKTRKFGKYNFNTKLYENELLYTEFKKQYKEYLRGQELINEKKLCTDPDKIKELDHMIDTEGRELDKFLIRAIVHNNFAVNHGMFNGSTPNKRKFKHKFPSKNIIMGIDIAKLDTSKITDMSQMFYDLDLFNSIINELKTKSNYDKEFPV
jgi:hypothetical protein